MIACAKYCMWRSGGVDTHTHPKGARKRRQEPLHILLYDAIMTGLKRYSHYFAAAAVITVNACESPQSIPCARGDVCVCAFCYQK